MAKQHSTGFKSHDVRRMHTCLHCQKIGIYEPGLLPIPALVCIYKSPDKKRESNYVHPRCLIQRNGLAAFLALPTSELGAITLDSISAVQMKAVLRELLSRRNAADRAIAAVRP